MDQTTNLLGALSLAISDDIEIQLRDTLNRSGEASAAIIFLGYLPGLSVEVLRQVLRLSHSGTVRMIDRLEEDGLVKRCKSDDGRAVAVHLSKAGQKLRAQLMKRRLDVLESALEGLTSNERVKFGKLMSKVLGNLPETEFDKFNICRLCEAQLCGECPIRGNKSILESDRKKNT